MACLLSASLPRQSALPPSLAGVHRIVCLGDSITQSGERPGGYVWLLRHYLNTLYPTAAIQVLNAGVSGNKSTDMIARFQRDVLDKSPDLLFISVGVNDVWHGFYDNHPKGDNPLGVPLDLYVRNVDSMVRLAKAKNSQVKLLAATLIGEDVSGPENKKAEAYNKALRTIARRQGIAIIDLQRPFRDLVKAYRSSTQSTQNFLTVDGVHMNPQGNQVMAQTILSHLGVPDADRVRVKEAVDGQIEEALHPAPSLTPPGNLLSEGKSATASSETPGCEASLATLPLTSPKHQPWCAKDGMFEPNPWWMVDLGKTYPLSGVKILFHPNELDTWKYRVELSDDGKAFNIAEDASQKDGFFTEQSHLFRPGARARFVRIVFTEPTSAMNWAALRNVQVFGN